MKRWKRDALELLKWMRANDVSGTGHTMPQLHRSSGMSRSALRGALAWLEQCCAVIVQLDEVKRKHWIVLADEDAEVAVPPPVEIADDLVDTSHLAELLAELELSA